MLILQEMKSKSIKTIYNTPNLYSKTFEDNISTLELARIPKLQLRTNNINSINHFFWSYVRDKSISTFSIDVLNNIVEILTQLLPQINFLHSQKKILEWYVQTRLRIYFFNIKFHKYNVWLHHVE